MIKHTSITALVATLSTAASISPCQAATISGTIDGVNYNYTQYQSAFTLDNISTDQVGFDITNAYVFCIDYTKDSYYVENGNQSVSNYSINEDLDTIENSTVWTNNVNQDHDLAIAQLGYAIDQFFTTKVEAGDINTRSAFAQVIWEITSDGGTANGLDISNGTFTRSLGGTTQSEMTSMIQDINNAGIDENYVWQRDSWIVKENNLANQDYIILSSTFTNPIPEPSTTLLLSAGVALTSLRRKRS